MDPPRGLGTQCIESSAGSRDTSAAAQKVEAVDEVSRCTRRARTVAGEEAEETEPAAAHSTRTATVESLASATLARHHSKTG